MNLMVLAAGEGTRFRPHTLVRPKPALPFLNVPLAFYSLGLLEGLPIERTIVNTFHLPDPIVKIFEKAPLPSKELFFSHEKTQIQGSGGGIKWAEKFFDRRKEVIMINGDEVILPQDPRILSKALQAHRKSGALATLLAIHHPEVGSRFGGVWTNDQNQILDIGKSPPPTFAHGYHFIGVFILSPEVFNLLPTGPSHIFTDVLLPALKKGHRLECFPIEATWFETGNLQDYLAGTEQALHLLQSTKPEGDYLKSFLKKVNPHYRDVDPKRPLVLSDSTLPADLDIKGFLVVGSKVAVPQKSHLENCVIASDCQWSLPFAARQELFLKAQL